MTQIAISLCFYSLFLKDGHSLQGVKEQIERGAAEGAQL